MKLSQNTLSAKLYRYFYKKEVMPSSLCVYFWKLIASYVFIIPFEVFGFPGRIVFSFIKKRKDSDIEGSYIINIGISMMLLISVSFLFCILYPIIYLFHPIHGFDIKTCLVIDALMLAGAFTIYCVASNKTYIVVQYIKAKIKGICPKIDWE